MGSRDVNVAASRRGPLVHLVPAAEVWRLSEDAAYVHYTANETIGGVEFSWVPDTGNVPLICDMSSNILSRRIDVARYGLIYAGAQKNIGPAGLTIVIIREDLIGLASTVLRHSLRLRQPRQSGVDVQHAADVRDLHRRPGLRHLLDTGGVAAAEERNVAKADLLYHLSKTVPTSTRTRGRPDRSRMNVPFTLADAALDGDFLSGAPRAGPDPVEGPSLGGRHAGLALQRHADRGRTGPRRLPGPSRGRKGLSS